MAKSGPIKDEDGHALNYLVVIDAGSRGSRVYVYYYVDPYAQPSTTGLPEVKFHKKWHHLQKPGLQTYANKPEYVGNHLDSLIALAKKWVPLSQHSRTPILLHATAGMRGVNDDKATNLMQQTCNYLQGSGFWLPTCNHVSVIDGDVEGLYAWMAINEAKGAFHDPTSDNNGDGHNTYGVLDMGGASSQIVMQPNSTETAKRENLMQLNLYYGKDSLLSYPLYSHSFEGMGLFEAWKKSQKLVRGSHPCVPSGNGGSGTFARCMLFLYKVISSECAAKDTTNGTTYSPSYGATKGTSFYTINGTTYGSTNGCLLTDDTIPNLDFNVNHFVGVSGYWDAISNVVHQDDSDIDDDENDATEYNYNDVYKATERVCNMDWVDIKHHYHHLDKDDMSMLCFKSAWVLGFLHKGLGFPGFGLEAPSADNDKFRQLDIVENLGDFKFSWTLGRALLYANDEYANALNKNDTVESGRAGYYKWVGTGNQSAEIYIYGSEQTESNMRPRFEQSRWERPTHRYAGLSVLAVMFFVLLYFLMGKERRHRYMQSISSKFRNKGYNRIDSDIELEDVRV